jgi:hydrogenase maturation protease
MPRKRVTVIGLGNDFVSDDGIGIYAASSLKTKMTALKGNFRDEVSIYELSTGGFQLLDYIIGCETCIIIDAAVTGVNPPGTIFRQVFSGAERPAKPVFSHQINLSELLGLAEMLKADVPSTIIIYGMEAADVTTFAASCSGEVQRALPQLIDLVFNDIVASTGNNHQENSQTATQTAPLYRGMASMC